MKRFYLLVLPLAILSISLIGHGETSLGHAADSDHKFDDFDKVVKGAKQYDGLFRLYQKDEHLFAEIRHDQLDKPFLCPIAIARGAGLGGYTLNFDEQWVLVFKRVGDKVQLIRRNVHFRAKAGSPAAHAVETTYNDSVLMALHIKAINHGRNSLLLNFNDIFMTNFAQMNLGSFDANRSSWHKIKVFPRNVELEVAATFEGGRSFSFFGNNNDSIIDDRGKTIVIHYGLCQLPDSGYHPRLADDRVGYFLSAVKDFSSDNEDTSFLRFANRWRLERAEPIDSKHPNKLSPPKKKIVFWIEKSVPVEYRAAVREGILEWNKAFEKIGFRDAIEVRQQEDEDFDPEDINYNTFRWITTDQGFAMGPSRANPLTGEIIDADIIFDASMVRFWREDAKLFRGESAPASLIQATRRGWGLIDPLAPESAAQASSEGWNDPKKAEQNRRHARLMASRRGICQCGAHMRFELGMASMALADKGETKPGEKIPDELIQQAVKETTMHEVGHTLGLRHNFKASTMLKNEQLHDTSITRKQGLVGSVMDYTPINLAPKGTKQGDYFSTTIGPYDYWAIAYAYKPLSGGTDGEVDKLRDIAKESAKAGHAFATDEDMYNTADPLVNVWDIGADPMKFAQERILLSEELFKGLEDRVVDKGEGYQRARLAFTVLLIQYGNAAHLTANFIGGEYMHRDHRGDPGARAPFVPVKADKQREALKFLQEHILSDTHFHFSPRLLRHLAADRWSHWGNESWGSVDYPLNQRILNIQRIVLDHVFHSAVLARVQNNALKADKDEKALTIAEMFRSVTDGIWSDGADKDKAGKRRLPSSVIRRNLQREHLKNLFALVLGDSSAPPDARSLARMHLRDINKRIKETLENKQIVVDDTTRAHLEESQERIAKVLNASMQVREP